MAIQASPIDSAQAFAGTEILLTGGNGFLGKVVLGLLLDRYPDFRHVHFLIRPRRGTTAQERFERDVLGSPALDPTLQKPGREEISQKITVWPGDIGQPDCGLDAAGIARLKGRAGLIVNCAGLVEFFPPVDQSFQSNVDGVENVVALAKQLGAKLLHVSTCYVAGEADGLIEESEPIAGFYPNRRGPADDSFDHAEELAACRAQIARITTANGNDRTKEVTERLVQLGRQRAARWGWVNTYTYAKSIGEQIIATDPDLESTIVRPAIVESALRFPFPGWVEGGRTAAPLVLMALSGLKDWPVRPEIPLEVVPVDLIAAATLAAGALLLNGRHKPVYQLGSADVNPMELGRLVPLLEDEARRRAGGTNGAPPRWIEPSRRLRLLTAAAAEARRKQFQRKVQRAQKTLGGMRSALASSGLPGAAAISRWSSELRTLELQAGFREQTLDQYLPFIFDNRYIFESQNIRDGHRMLSEADQARLPWDPESIDWERYWRVNQIEGIRKWVQPEAVREWAFKI